MGLACFGLPHVLSELRYVDARFKPRVPGGVLALWGLLLAAVVVGRAGALLGAWWVPPRLELGLVAALVASALLVPGASWPWRVVAVLCLAALAAGLTLAPLATFVALSLLHNLTPLGLLAERLEGSRRRRALVLGGLLFLGLPLLILLGAPQGLLGQSGAAPFGVALSDQLKGFVFPAWRSASWAERLFAAAVFTQCLHYLYVLLILPALDGRAAWWGEPSEGAERGTLLPWPGPLGTGLLLCAAAGLSLGLFLTLGFGPAKRCYALPAAVHAWIELPLLLAAPALLSRAAAAK